MAMRVGKNVMSFHLYAINLSIILYLHSTVIILAISLPRSVSVFRLIVLPSSLFVQPPWAALRIADLSVKGSKLLFYTA